MPPNVFIALVALKSLACIDLTCVPSNLPFLHRSFNQVACRKWMSVLRKRGIVRASITRLSNRIKKLGGKVDQPSTFDLTKRDKDKLESLNSEFKVHHYAIVDILDKSKDLTKEQEVLDEHDVSIAELIIRMQKVISVCAAASDPNPCKIQSRRLAHLEKSLSAVSEEIKMLSERCDDTCLICQHGGVALGLQERARGHS